MSNTSHSPDPSYKEILALLDQLIEISIWQDAGDKANDPVKYSGESFMTNKLKLIQQTLKK